MVDAEPSNVFYPVRWKNASMTAAAENSQNKGYFLMLSKSYQTGHSVST
jgi:hypothetical protein